MTAAERHELIDEIESKGISSRSACRWSGYSRAIGRYELRRPMQEAEWLEQNNVGPAFIPPGQPWKSCDRSRASDYPELSLAV